MNSRHGQNETVGLLYSTYKPYLLPIAYRMLGSVSDAEDIIHDTFESMHSVRLEDIANIQAYLARMVTNRCLNELNSAKKKRVSYVGAWLPEPLVTDRDNEPLSALEQDETLSYAFLLMLDRLSPVERVVFVLREVLEFGYEEIADIVERSEANCRKIFSRAKNRMKRPSESRPPIDHAREAELARQFAQAFTKADVAALTELLSEDAVLVSDGGGKVKAAINPIVGRDRVTALLSFLPKSGYVGAGVCDVMINGRPGLLFTKADGLRAAYSFEWTEDGTIRRIYIVANPDKLRHVRL